MKLKYLAVIAGLVFLNYGCGSVPVEKQTNNVPEVKTEAPLENKKEVPAVIEKKDAKAEAPAPEIKAVTAEAKIMTEENMMAKTVVSAGDSVEVEYEGSLKDGKIFDSSKGRAPLAFKVGAGQMIKGFDNGVVGMKLSEEKIINIKAVDGYGERDEKMTQKVPKDFFPKDYKLVKGAEVGLRHKNGQPMNAVISDIVADGIILDFNHFLAGKDLVFKVKVVSIK